MIKCRTSSYMLIIFRLKHFLSLKAARLNMIWWLQVFHFINKHDGTFFCVIELNCKFTAVFCGRLRMNEFCININCCSIKWTETLSVSPRKVPPGLVEYSWLLWVCFFNVSRTSEWNLSSVQAKVPLMTQPNYQFVLIKAFRVYAYQVSRWK